MASALSQALWTILYAKTGKMVSRLLEGHTNGVTSVAFSPDCKRVVSGSWDETIRVWNLEMDEVVAKPLEHQTNDNRLNGNGFTAITPRFGDNSKLADGWIHGSNSELLFWVPPLFRDGLWRPRNTVVIAKVSTRLDFNSFVHGNSWTQCAR